MTATCGVCELRPARGTCCAACRRVLTSAGFRRYVVAATGAWDPSRAAALLLEYVEDDLAYPGLEGRAR